MKTLITVTFAVCVGMLAAIMTVAVWFESIDPAVGMGM